MAPKKQAASSAGASSESATFPLLDLPGSALAAILAILQPQQTPPATSSSSEGWFPAARLRLVCKDLRDAISFPRICMQLPDEQELQHILSHPVYSQWLAAAKALTVRYHPSGAPQPQQIITAAVSHLLAAAAPPGNSLVALTLDKDLPLMEGLLSFTSLPGLSRLRCRSPLVWGDAPTALRPITSLTHLTHLVLDPAPATTHCLTALTTLQHLTHLGLQGEAHDKTVARMDDLLALPHLSHLSLSRMEVKGVSQPSSTPPTLPPGWKCVQLVQLVRFSSVLPQLLPSTLTSLNVCGLLGWFEEYQYPAQAAIFRALQPQRLPHLHTLHTAYSGDYDMIQAPWGLRTLSLTGMGRLFHPLPTTPDLRHLHVGMPNQEVEPDGIVDVGDMCSDLSGGRGLPTSLVSLSLLEPDVEQDKPWDMCVQPSFQHSRYWDDVECVLEFSHWLTSLDLPHLKRLLVQGLRYHLICTPPTPPASSAQQPRHPRQQPVAGGSSSGAGAGSSSGAGVGSSSGEGAGSYAGAGSDRDVAVTTSAEGPALRSLWLVVKSIEPGDLPDVIRLPPLRHLTRLVIINLQGFEWRTAPSRTWQTLATLTQLQDLQLGCFRYVSQIQDVLSHVPPSCPSLQHLVLRLHPDNNNGAAQQQVVAKARAKLLDAWPRVCMQVLRMDEPAWPDVWPPEAAIDEYDLIHKQWEHEAEWGHIPRYPEPPGPVVAYVDPL